MATWRMRRTTPVARRCAPLVNCSIDRSSSARWPDHDDRAMSQKTVQSIIGRLITDEEYRLRFLNDPLGTLNELRDQGVELTRGEIDALARTERTLWIEA